MCEAGIADERADAAGGTVVETESGIVGLRLETDADVFYGRGEEGVGEAGEGTGKEVLGIGEVGAGRERGRVGFGVVVGGGIAGFKSAAGVMEAAELDGNLSFR